MIPIRHPPPLAPLYPLPGWWTQVWIHIYPGPHCQCPLSTTPHSGSMMSQRQRRWPVIDPAWASISSTRDHTSNKSLSDVRDQLAGDYRDALSLRHRSRSQVSRWNNSFFIIVFKSTDEVEKESTSKVTADHLSWNLLSNCILTVHLNIVIYKPA